MSRTLDSLETLLNPIFYIDFYKVGHVSQYHSDVAQIFSNWTARSSRVEGAKGTIFFGLNYLLKKYIIKEFDEHFFARPLEDVLAEYRLVIRETLHVENPRTDHIEALHRLGHMPLTVYALPEGSFVPLGVPSMVVTAKGAEDEFFWLTNYIETLLSNILWKPSTSATTAREYRKVFLKHARRYGAEDLSFVDWQGHDFSFRGMSGVEDAIISGMGHLLYFSGTDTVPAILAANHYYHAGLSCGGSVAATEHSVMSAGMEDGEFETFKRLITEVYPTGIVSIVSDTWDLWRVLTDYIPRLKETILARDGKIVIRPDSGDPVDIICGDHGYELNSNYAYHPKHDGVIQLLHHALGSEQGLLRKVGTIYGDSITVERANRTLKRIIDEQHLSPYNYVAGIGSYTYQYVTRDTYGHAMKATAYKSRKTGEIVPIFKKPVTDNGTKFSHRGIPIVNMDLNQNTELTYVLRPFAGTEEQLDNCEFRKVFENGKLLVDPTFAEIRERARRGL